MKHDNIPKAYAVDEDRDPSLTEKMDIINNFDDKHSILMGVNKDEGTKALMYFLPRIFPNRELHEMHYHIQYQIS